MQSRFGSVTPAICRHRGVSHAAFRLYAILTTFADENGACFPSVAVLAEEFGASERNVQLLLGQLVEARVLRREVRRRANGSQASNHYVLTDVAPPPAMGEGESQLHPGGVKASFTPESHLHPLKETLTSNVESPKTLTPQTEILDPSAESCTRGHAREESALADPGLETGAGNNSESGKTVDELKRTILMHVEFEGGDRALVNSWLRKWPAIAVQEAHAAAKAEMKRHGPRLQYTIAIRRELTRRRDRSNWLDEYDRRDANIAFQDAIGTPM